MATCPLTLEVLGPMISHPLRLLRQTKIQDKSKIYDSDRSDSENEPMKVRGRLEVTIPQVMVFIITIAT